MNRNRSKVAEAWSESNKDPEFWQWANLHRKQAFVRHVQRHGSLFEAVLTPYISKVLDVPEEELNKINSKSTNLDTVVKWFKSKRKSKIELPQSAWMLAGMMRGKYHQFLAREEGLQLLQHAFRKGMSVRRKTISVERVNNSESHFINIVIASALTEKNPDKRVVAWLNNIENARLAILRQIIPLPSCDVESTAESLAFDAAKKIGIPSYSAAFSRFLDWTVSVTLGTAIAYGVAPWIWPAGVVVSPTIQQIYNSHVLTGRPLCSLPYGIFTRRRFQKLQKTVAGRIEHIPITGS